MWCGCGGVFLTLLASADGKKSSEVCWEGGGRPYIRCLFVFVQVDAETGRSQTKQGRQCELIWIA